MDGSLIRALPPWCQPFPGFYLYVPSRDRMPLKIRALMYFLTEKRPLLEVEKKMGWCSQRVRTPQHSGEQ